MDLLTGSKPAVPKLVNPTIRIHVPLDPEETVNVNFTALAEAKYGWDALHPVAARLRALNRYDSEEESDSDMQDVTGEAGSGQAAPPAQPLQPSQPKKRKRRKMNEYETYDIDDPFIDDDELNLQELTAVSKDGFFVFQGPLVGEGDKVRIEKADGTARRGNAGGLHGASGTAAAKRSAHARSKSKATASTTTTAASPAAAAAAAASTPVASAHIGIADATPASNPGSPQSNQKQTNGKGQASTPVAPAQASTTPPKTSAPVLSAKAAVASASAATVQAVSETPVPASAIKSMPPSPSAPDSPANNTGDAATAMADALKKSNKPPRTDEQRRHMRETAARRRAQKKEETRLEVLRRALRNPLLDTSELQAAMAMAGGEALVSLQDVIKLTNRALGLAEHSAAATTEAKLKELDNERKAPPLDMENIVEAAKRVAAVAMQSYLLSAQDGSGGSVVEGSGASGPVAASPPGSHSPSFVSPAEESTKPTTGTGASIKTPTSAQSKASAAIKASTSANPAKALASTNIPAKSAPSTQTTKSKTSVRSPDKVFVKPTTPVKAKKDKKDAITTGSPSGRSMSLTALLD